MILLLDANGLLWALDKPSQLDASVRASISDPVNPVLVSAATVWELEIKAAKGKLRLPADLLDSIEAMPADVVPVLGTDARTAARLPMHHHDPFDRMLVAQAQRLGAVVVSADPALDAYGVHRLAPLGET
jgi:PIN domain nuclease of toxin-antitoxin system